MIDDPEVTVVDTRNKYETLIGSFQNAIDPKIASFTEFSDYVRKNLDPTKNKKIAMFCTGGIRCEKASAFMLSEGFEERQLKGEKQKQLSKEFVREWLIANNFMGKDQCPFFVFRD